jgi:chemotaxis protein CheC
MDNTIPVNFNEQLRILLEVMAKDGIYRAAEGLSGLMGEHISVSQPHVSLMPLAELPNALGGPENEAVGIYLQFMGEIGGQVMIVLPYAKALQLVDLLLGQAAGTTEQLGSLERSALAEMGNLTTSFFLNAIASSTGITARPTPPAVMVDMVGAVIDIIVSVCGAVSDLVLMIDACFMRADQEVEASFWLIPDPATLRVFARQDVKHGG